MFHLGSQHRFDTHTCPPPGAAASYRTLDVLPGAKMPLVDTASVRSGPSLP